MTPDDAPRRAPGKYAGMKFKRIVRPRSPSPAPTTGPAAGITSPPPGPEPTATTSQQHTDLPIRRRLITSPVRTHARENAPAPNDLPPGPGGSVAEAPKAPPKPIAPPTFRVNRYGPVPPVCPPFEGKVAARDLFTTMVITTPNMDYVPQYPVERTIVQTFSNGRWGVHDYSRHPQVLLPEMMHVACIPRRDPEDDSLAVLFEDLLPATHWKDDPETGVKGLGYVKEDTRKALAKLAAAVDAKTESCSVGNGNVRAHARLLRLLLRQVVDRMTHVPSSPGVAIAVAAHVQRLCLELEGMFTYLSFVQPRLTRDTDHSLPVLPVLGTFVREATDAQTCVRVGLPTWFLQPLTHQVKIWRIVEVEPAIQPLRPSQPPIFHDTRVVAGVLNLTSNWLSTMAMAVSRQVCGSRLPGLSTDSGSAGEGQPASKRPRMDPTAMHSKHLELPSAAAGVAGVPTKKSKKRKARATKLGAGGPTVSPNAGSPSNAAGISAAGRRSAPVEGAGDRRDAIVAHPSRSFVSSPFYSVPEVWRGALVEASPLPQPPASVVYFYPPPFLLDTVSSLATLPEPCEHPELARKDEKVHQYLHNLVRIRHFCRARLFDPSLSSQPLTIAEWRAALWGDYEIHAHRAGGKTEADVRRAQKRQDERNGISRLLGRTALLPSYRPDLTPELDALPISALTAATVPSVRVRLLWEAHEVNFRCEFMALDTALVHRPDWTEMHRWQREGFVSGIWGPESSVVSVIPPLDVSEVPFCWSSPPEATWREHRRYLSRFLEVMTRWPDAPDVFVDVDVQEDCCTPEVFEFVQRQAVDFYIRSFVARFHRLPTPPIRMPSICFRPAL